MFKGCVECIKIDLYNMHGTVSSRRRFWKKWEEAWTVDTLVGLCLADEGKYMMMMVVVGVTEANGSVMYEGHTVDSTLRN